METLAVSTGQPAPVSGWWRPDADPKPYRRIQKGEVMPSLAGSQAFWVLVLPLAIKEDVDVVGADGRTTSALPGGSSLRLRGA